MPIIDDAILKQLQEDISPEDMRSVLTSFAADMQRLGAALHDAQVEGDNAQCRRVCHGIAGAAGAVGAADLEEASRAVMAAVHDGMAVTPAEVDGIHHLIACTLAALKHYGSAPE